MLVDARGLGLSVNGHPILDDVSVSLGRGEVLGLIGPNGAGKTTLLRILARAQQPERGSYAFQGEDIGAIKCNMLARSIGYLPQGSPAHWPLRVRRVIELGRLPYQGWSRRLTESDTEAVLAASRQTEVEHLLDRIVTTLSGGELTRVLLARLFATCPTLILADEPVAALDPYHQLHVMEILRRHARQGGAVIVVLHDLNHAARFCDRLLLLDKGRVVACGGIQDLLEQDLLQDVYRIDLRVFRDEQGVSITAWERRPAPG